MFDFEKFPVYLKTEDFIKYIQPILKDRSVEPAIPDKLYRASSSVLLNIAEGGGKYSKKDKKNYYVISRGSVNECIAILRLLRIESNIKDELFNSLYSQLLIIAKMLSGLINKMRT